MDDFCRMHFFGEGLLVGAFEIIDTVKFLNFAVEGYVDCVLVLVFVVIFGGEFEEFFGNVCLAHFVEVKENHPRVYVQPVNPERLFIADAFYVDIAYARAIAVCQINIENFANVAVYDCVAVQIQNAVDIRQNFGYHIAEVCFFCYVFYSQSELFKARIVYFMEDDFCIFVAVFKRRQACFCSFA